MKNNFKKGVLSLFFFVITLSVVFVAYEYLSLKGSGIIVLLYHRVSEHGTGKYVIRPNKFEQQMRYLKSRGYETILPRDIVDKQNITNLSKTIILSFDDGTADHYATVYPILKRYGLKGVFFVITKYVGSPGNLTAERIKRMARDGMEFGSHTYSHPFLDELDDREIYYELERSKNDLEHIIGGSVICLAPPGGWFDKRTVKIAKSLGYRALFSCEIGVNDPGHQDFIFARIEVPGSITNEQFAELIKHDHIFTLRYKIVQTLKFLLHGLIGSNNYSYLAKAL